MNDSSSGTRQKPLELSQGNHRRLIGVLGLFLPVLLFILAGLWPTGGLVRWELLDSVSAYYYTGGMGVFVGVLFTLALFLMTYPGYEGTKADRVLGLLGGTAALGVALFPTAAPPPLIEPSWWSSYMRVMHYVSAVTLFVSFILFSIWLFRKSDTPKRLDRPVSKRRRDNVCLACGIIMIVCVLWAGSAVITNAPIFLPEAIAIMAFAVSWLTKGKAHRPLVKIYHGIRTRF